MVTVNTIARFLNKELKIRKIKGDGSRNGLQVRGRKEVKKIGFAVDACMEVFEKAKKQKCDLIVVHHGLKWRGKKDNLFNKRMNYLKKNNISLYGCHLPLDKCKKHGNNIELCRILGVKKIKGFARYKGQFIGYKGEFEKPMNLSTIVKKINKKLKTKSQVLGFGKKKIKKIGIVSGGGAFALWDAVKDKLDVFLTGEIKHSTFHHAKENKLNVIAAGHYATETVGVKALQRLLKQKFNIQTVFINNATGL